jgi:chromosome segregation ATPase
MENFGFSMSTIMGWVVSIAGAFAVVRYQVSVLNKNHEALTKEFERQKSDNKNQAIEIAVMKSNITDLKTNYEKLDKKLDAIFNIVNELNKNMAALSCNRKGGASC